MLAFPFLWAVTNPSQSTEAAEDRDEAHVAEAPEMICSSALLTLAMSSTASPAYGEERPDSSIQPVEQLQDLLIGRDVRHGMAIVHVADPARLVHHDLSRHPAQLEELDLLSVALEDGVLGIGKAGEGKPVFLPVTREGLGPFRSHDNDLGPPGPKLLVSLAQLRHVPTAERSGEASVEDEDHMGFALEIRETDLRATEVLKGKVRCWGVQGDSRHQGSW